MSLLWGFKTDAWFDVWTIEHILSGLSIGTFVKSYHHKLFERIVERKHDFHSWHFNLTAVLCLGFAWETVEHYLETGLSGTAVTHWLQGVEFWGNRLVTDPLMLVLGYAVAKRFQQLVVPARALSVAWLFTHACLFPHSMYLHELSRQPVLTLLQGLVYSLPALLSCTFSFLYLVRWDSARRSKISTTQAMPPGTALLQPLGPVDS